MSEHVIIAHVDAAVTFNTINQDIARVRSSVEIIGDVAIGGFGEIVTESFDTPRTLDEVHQTLRQIFPPRDYTVVYNEEAECRPSAQAANFAVIHKAQAGRNSRRTSGPFPAQI